MPLAPPKHRPALLAAPALAAALQAAPAPAQIPVTDVASLQQQILAFAQQSATATQTLAIMGTVQSQLAAWNVELPVISTWRNLAPDPTQIGTATVAVPVGATVPGLGVRLDATVAPTLTTPSASQSATLARAPAGLTGGMWRGATLQRDAQAIAARTNEIVASSEAALAQLLADRQQASSMIAALDRQLAALRQLDQAGTADTSQKAIATRQAATSAVLAQAQLEQISAMAGEAERRALARQEYLRRTGEMRRAALQARRDVLQQHADYLATTRTAADARHNRCLGRLFSADCADIPADYRVP